MLEYGHICIHIGSLYVKLYWESIALNFYKYVSSTTVTSGEHVFVGVYGWSNGVPDGFPTRGNVWLLEQQESTQTR